MTIERPSSDCPTCECYHDLDDQAKARIKGEVQAAIERINGVLQGVGLSDCAVDHIGFGGKQALICRVECEVRAGALECWCD